LNQLEIEHIPSYAPEGRGRWSVYPARCKAAAADAAPHPDHRRGRRRRWLSEVYIDHSASRWRRRERPAFIPFVGVSTTFVCRSSVVSNDNTVRYGGRVLQIRTEAPTPLRQTTVKRTYPDGRQCFTPAPAGATTLPALTEGSEIGRPLCGRAPWSPDKKRTFDEPRKPDIFARYRQSRAVWRCRVRRVTLDAHCALSAQRTPLMARTPHPSRDPVSHRNRRPIIYTLAPNFCNINAAQIQSYTAIARNPSLASAESSWYPVRIKERCG
jgi:hypothetical protein